MFYCRVKDRDPQLYQAWAQIIFQRYGMNENSIPEAAINNLHAIATCMLVLLFTKTVVNVAWFY